MYNQLLRDYADAIARAVQLSKETKTAQANKAEEAADIAENPNAMGAAVLVAAKGATVNYPIAAKTLGSKEASEELCIRLAGNLCYYNSLAFNAYEDNKLYLDGYDADSEPLK